MDPFWDCDNGEDVEDRQPYMVENLLEEDDVSMADILALKAAGFSTIESIAYCPTSELRKVEFLNLSKLDKIVRAAKYIVPRGFITVTQTYHDRGQTVRISSGSRLLDELIHGGVEKGTITEIYGESGSGKSQLCHTMCVTCQLPISVGGGEGKALYIDTEGTFRPARIAQIAESYGLHSGDILDNIAIARAQNTDQQSRLLIAAGALMQDSRFAILVVDSLTHLYRSEFSEQELSSRQLNIGKYMRKLQTLADHFGVAVIITNQVVAIMDGSAGGVKAIGGNVVAHASTHRLFLRRSVDDERLCRVTASPCIREGEARFKVGIGGVTDVEGRIAVE